MMTDDEKKIEGFDGIIYQSKMNQQIDKVGNDLIDNNTIIPSKMNIDPKTKEGTYEWYIEQKRLGNIQDNE